MAMTLPTGTQIGLLRPGPHGDTRATITSLAASLRALRVGGTALVHEYPEDRPAPGGAGIVLVPWPNRVAGARWRLDGVEQLLDVTEPSRGNASHGLLRNTEYAVVHRSEAEATLAAHVFPQHGYPFTLATAVTYRVRDDGLRVTHRLVNEGSTAAPVAVGAHPYLRVGEAPVADLVVTVSGRTYLRTDDRSIPVAREAVDGSQLDLREGRRLGDVRLDTAYTDLALDGGCHRHRLTAPDGRAVELWADPDFGHVQIYTNSAFAGLGGVEDAVAVEPMTAPADALNSGEGLRWLAPGGSWTLSWGIRLLG
jgi:aldose 1-epimerase